MQSQVVVIAAGTGNRSVLASVRPCLDLPQIRPHHQVRPLHIFCVRGPRRILGCASTIVMRPGYAPLMIGCNAEDPETSVLYVTPYPWAPQPQASPAHAQWTMEECAADAVWPPRMEVQADYAADCLHSLFAEHPHLKTEPALEFAWYGCMKQDANWDGAPMQVHLGKVDCCPNLLVLNIQFVGLLLAAGEAVAARVREAGVWPTASGRVPKAVGETGLADAVGSPEDERQELKWLPLQEFSRSVGVTLDL